MKQRYTALILSFFLASCSLVEDASRIQAPQWSPEFAVPVAQGSITLSEILDQWSEVPYLSADSNGLMRFVYESDPVTVTGEDLLVIPDFGMRMFGTEVSLPFPLTGVQEIGCSGGQVQLSWISQENSPVELTIEIPVAANERGIFSQTFVIQNPAQWQDSVFLAGYTLYLTDGTFDFRYTATRISDGQAVSPDRFDWQIHQLRHSYAEGYFGQYYFPIGADTTVFELPAALEGLSVYLEDPRAGLDIRNSFGIPIRVNLPVFQGVMASGEVIPIAASQSQEGFMLAYPGLGQKGNDAFTRITLDKSNSRLSEVLSPALQAVNWQLDAISHPAGDPSEYGFILDSSRFDIRFWAEVPIYGGFSQVSVSQEFDISPQTIEQLRSADLRLITDNGFPFEAQVQAYFLDESGQVLDSLFAGQTLLLEAAPVDGNGRVTTAARHLLDIPLSESKLDAIFSARKIRVKGTFASTQSGSVPVKLYEGYSLGIRLGVKAEGAF